MNRPQQKESGDGQFRDPQPQLMMSQMVRTVRPVKCKDHQEETYTNFCLHKDCMRALCPDCMERHTQFHKQNSTYPDLQSIKNVKIKCKQKLQEVKNNVEQLYDQIDDLVQNQHFDDQDEGAKKIMRFKEIILDHVNTYFEQLLDKYRSRASSLIEKDEKIKNIQDRLSIFLEEIELMQGKMEGAATQIDTLNEVQNLDWNGQLSEVQTQIQDLLDIHHRQSIDIIVEESKVRMLKTDLVQYIRLGQYIFHDEKDQTNNIQFSSPSQPGIKNHSPVLIQAEEKQDAGNTTFPDHIDTDPSIDGKDQQGNNKSIGEVSQVAEIEISQPSYFENSNPHKVVPFFCPDNKTLYLIDANSYDIKKSHLISEQIGDLGRTIITPRGDIYILGGLSKSHESKQVFKFDYTDEKFVERQPMNLARTSFAVIFADKSSLFVVGGKREGIPCADCERYDIVNNKWKTIASLNYAAYASSLCTYNNQYIYKFGGIGPNLQQNNNYVERYDIYKDQWETIRLMLEDLTGIHSISHSKMFAFYFQSGAIQVSDGSIYVFGGQLEKKIQKSTFCFNIRRDLANNIMHVLNRFDYIPLPSPGSFTSNPIIHNEKILCLQNIDNPSINGTQNNKKRLLIFDGTKWIEIIKNFH